MKINERVRSPSDECLCSVPLRRPETISGYYYVSGYTHGVFLLAVSLSLSCSHCILFTCPKLIIK